tara:strand:- start:951 stop:1784 length:834 start_codon:yes stop_codon:yes gene_type:complete
MKLTKQKLYKLIQEQLDDKAAKGIQTVVAKGNIPERYALFVQRYVDSYDLVLYQLPPLEPQVVAFCRLDKTKKPCIPVTYEIKTIARKAGRDYKGLGAVMYDIAATIVKRKHNGGITSDHSHSSSTAAYKGWQRMANSGKYVKRATKWKNDKFDYTGNETPDDPNDNCDKPAGRGDPDMSDELRKKLVAASDYSLQIKTLSPYLSKFKINHMKAMRVAEKLAKANGEEFNADEIEEALVEEGEELFRNIYFQANITKLTKDYFSMWNKIKRFVGIKQ